MKDRKKYDDAYCKRHPDRRAESLRKYRAKNLALYAEASRRHYWKNRDNIRVIRAENGKRKSTKDSVALWKASNPEKIKAAYRNCRAKRITEIAGKKISAAEWAEIKKQYGQMCVYCYEKKILTMEHIVPLSRGGQHTIENVVPACRSCNSRKRNKSLEEFMALGGR